LFYTEDTVTRATSNSYILLVCSGIEEAVHLLNTDGLEQKIEKEGYGDYFKRIKIVPTMSQEMVDILNDVFILRHWIIHRNGSIRVQTTSESEKNVLDRAGDDIEMDLRHIIIRNAYVDRMAKMIDDFLKNVAKAKYEKMEKTNSTVSERRPR